MDEDLTNDNEEASQEQVQDKPNRSDNRFKDLADKVKTTAEERDTYKAEVEKAKKDAEFYKGFSTTASKYQGAADYQDDIKKKVDSGYDLEDATISVLAKAGKLNNAPVQRESPAGGSASTSMTNSGEKTLNEMTRAEKREELIRMENESGGISKILRNGLR